MDKGMNAPNGFYETFWQDDHYQQAYAFDSAVRDRFPAIQKVWGDLKKPTRVLDFGCGNGVLTYWLHCNDFADDILGVDISATGVRNAQTHFARQGLRYELAGFLDESAQVPFDVVVSSHVIEHIDDPAAAVQRLKTLAEWMVIEVPLERCLVQDLLAMVRGKSRKDNALGHVNFWTKQSFLHFLQENGVMVVRDYQYASAPFSPYSSAMKRLLERLLLGVVGLGLYSRLMATHYIVLARKHEG